MIARIALEQLQCFQLGKVNCGVVTLGEVGVVKWGEVRVENLDCAGEFEGMRWPRRCRRSN